MTQHSDPLRQSIDEELLERQRTWSDQTFGPGRRTVGLIQHIRKELLEIDENPTDLFEWVDVMVLAIDGAGRAGYTPAEILSAYRSKMEENFERTWQDWRLFTEDQAIEHVREIETHD